MPVSVLTMLSILPAFVGWLLARRTGVLGGLVFAGSAFVIWEMIGDPEYALLMWADDQTLETIVSIHPQLFFLIITPVLVMRSRLVKAQVAGLLVPISVAFVSAAAIGSAIRPHSSFGYTVAFDFLLILLPLGVVAVASVRADKLGPDRQETVQCA